MLKILGETLPSKQWEVAGELAKIKIAFDEGIEIPFPQIVMHRPKALKRSD
jgi:small conductance mechanosensitive channel